MRVEPTPAYPHNAFCVYEVREDPQTRLPSYIELRSDSGDKFTLDYKVLDGHWVIVRGTMTTQQHFGPMSFQVVAQTDYQDIAFPAEAPDPRLAGTPAPAAS
jgi:hypothetical protein